MEQSLRSKFENRLSLYRSFVNQGRFRLEDYHSYLKVIPDINFRLTEIQSSEFHYEMFGLKFKVACEINSTFKTGFVVTHLAVKETDGRLLFREVARVGFDRNGYPTIEDDPSAFLFNATLDFVYGLNDMNAPLIW